MEPDNSTLEIQLQHGGIEIQTIKPVLSCRRRNSSAGRAYKP
jgi:hypothetical protein